MTGTRKLGAAGGCPRARRESDITNHGRLAACLCAISIAFAVCAIGGPVAAADTESDGSVSDTNGLGDTDHETGTEQVDASGSPAEPGAVGTLPSLFGGLDGGSLFGSENEETEHEATADDEGAREEGNEESSGLAGPMALGGTTITEPSAGASPPADEGNGGSDSVTTPEIQTNEPEVPEALVSHSPVTEPSQAAEAPVAEAPPPPVDPPAAEPPAVEAVGVAAVLVEEPAAPIQAEAAQLIGGAAPASDIVTALANLFIALTDTTISLIEIPNNLLSFLGLSPMADGTTVSMNAGGIGGSLLAGGLYSAVRTQLASSQALQGGLPEMLLALGRSSGLSSPGVVHRSPGGLGASGMAEQHSVGLKATLAGGLVPDLVRSVIQYTVDAFLAPLSLVILAALASPGVAGLLLLSAVGMFVGYRQAKAASMLRAVGIARFVKSGPLGVVRSGSLVAVHPRTSIAGEEQPRRTKRHLESVA